MVIIALLIMIRAQKLLNLHVSFYLSIILLNKLQFRFISIYRAYYTKYQKILAHNFCNITAIFFLYFTNFEGIFYNIREFMYIPDFYFILHNCIIKINFQICLTISMISI